MIAEKEAIKLVEEEYPGYSAEVIADVGNEFYVKIIQNGKSDELADVHTVNKETGEVSGNIPIGKVLENLEVVNQMMDRSKKKMM